MKEPTSNQTPTHVREIALCTVEGNAKRIEHLPGYESPQEYVADLARELGQYLLNLQFDGQFALKVTTGPYEGDLPTELLEEYQDWLAASVDGFKDDASELEVCLGGKVDVSIYRTTDLREACRVLGVDFHPVDEEYQPNRADVHREAGPVNRLREDSLKTIDNGLHQWQTKRKPPQEGDDELKEALEQMLEMSAAKLAELELTPEQFRRLADLCEQVAVAQTEQELDGNSPSIRAANWYFQKFADPELTDDTRLKLAEKARKMRRHNMECLLSGEAVTLGTQFVKATSSRRFVMRKPGSNTRIVTAPSSLPNNFTFSEKNAD